MDDFTSSFPQEIKNAQTIQDVLRRRAQITPEAHAVSFLTYPDGQEHIETLSYAQLDQQAGAIAQALLTYASPGDRVLLAHDPGLSFITSFFGCLYAGMIAVPLAPPRARDQVRIHAIAQDAGARLMLMHSDQAERWNPVEAPMLTCLPSESLALGEGYMFHAQSDAGNTLAFLQYTSGTTGTQKGVMVRQTELLTNLNQIRNACELDASSIALNWLPLYHDMGLIGTLLTPIFTGFPTLLLSPFTFVQHPEYWLRSISQHRATICGGPGFAYQHCLDLVPHDKRGSFDFSHWRIAFCGSEMIHAQALESFATAFAASGFSAHSFYPCYGMAEATLFITGCRPGQGALIENFDGEALEQGLVNVVTQVNGRLVRRLVGCGYPFPDTTICIVNAQGEPSPDGEIGEVWASGPGLAAGYWQKAQITENIFAAVLEKSPGKRFLRTGDLGFFYKGQLFISGRLKDLIIIDGRNIVPQDLEWVAKAASPEVIQAAAFSILNDEREHVVMLVEVERRRDSDFAAISKIIRRAVAQSLAVPLHAVALVRSGQLKRTTSGKLARSACRRHYVGSHLSMLHHWRADTVAPPGHMASLPATPWLLRPRIHAAPALRLYCFGYGGGGASAFLPWRAYLDKRIEICPLQLPGRENRIKEPPIRRLSEIYSLFEDLAAQTNVPFAFCGYSMGGRIAFALAQHLRSKNLPGPECLFLSAIREPSLMPEEPAYRFSDEDLLNYATLFGEIPAYIKQRPDMLKMVLNLFRADMELSETIDFANARPLDCPIHVFGGLDDPAVKIEHLLHWRKHARGTFTAHLLAGPHMFLEQQRTEFLQLIAGLLAPLLKGNYDTAATCGTVFLSGDSDRSSPSSHDEQVRP